MHRVEDRGAERSTDGLCLVRVQVVPQRGNPRPHPVLCVSRRPHSHGLAKPLLLQLIKIKESLSARNVLDINFNRRGGSVLDRWLVMSASEQASTVMM